MRALSHPFRLVLLAGLLLVLLPAPARAADEPAPAAGQGAVGERVAEGIEAAVEEDIHETSGGLPQLDASTYASQVFWLILAFVVLYYLLTRKALPRVAEILEARQDRLAADLDRAARLRAEAEAAEARYEQVLADARDRAATQIRSTHEAVQGQLSAAQADLDRQLAGRIAEAEGRIAEGHAAALEEISGVAAEAVRAATTRLVGLKVTAAEARAAVDRVARGAA